MNYCLLCALALLQLSAWALQDSYTQKFERGRQFRADGHYREAETAFRDALDTARSIASRSEDVANSLDQLASLYNQSGRYNEAEPLYRQSLQLWLKLRGRHDPHVIAAMSNLASVHLGQARLEEAQLGLRKVLELQQSLSETGPEHAVVLNNLALVYLERGKPASAEAVLQRAIRTLEDALGPDHPKTIETLENLATVALVQGHSVQAEEIQQRLVAQRERMLGPTHPLTAGSLEKLAQIYQKQRRHGEAEALYRRALAAWEGVGTQHVNLYLVLNNLAALLMSASRYSEAELLCVQAVVTAEQLFGIDHPRVGRVLAIHATALRKLGRGAEAKKLEQRSRIIAAKNRLNGLTVDIHELAQPR
jgi:Tfp pilus assembly protein PilF